MSKLCFCENRFCEAKLQTKFIMKRYITLLFTALTLIALLHSCGGEATQTTAEAEPIKEPEIIKRYGVPIEGYTIETYKLLSGQTMGNIMSKNGRSALDIDRVDKAAREIFPLRKMRAGQSYTLFLKCDTLGNKQLDYIAYERNNIDYVLFTMVGDSIGVATDSKPTKVIRNKKTATIKSSLWGAVMEAKLPYILATELEDIYQWSVDFFGVQPNDSFTVIYDELFVEDSISVGIGQIWGAKFNQSGKDYYAIPFRQNEDKTEFWDELGGSMRKQMLKAPLKYSRISSRFSNARLHPIYKVYRPHHGVDYAAPTGTPVHSVADGVVVFKGWGGGGGNSLKIKHPNDIMTGYLHLSRYAAGIANGTRVKQGDLIGYVGSTGDSTGPHLDYRVWRHGTAIDPLKIPQTPSKPISASNRADFNYTKDHIIAELTGDIPESEQIRTLKRIKPEVAADSVGVTVAAVVK